MTLLFLVRYQTVSLIDTKVEPRQGSAKYLELKFIFATPDWAALRKTLHISSGEFSEPYILESNLFRVPTYYTQQNSFCITLLGDSGGTLVPTNVLEISLSASNKLWQATPPDPENSAYILLMQQLAGYEDRLTALERIVGNDEEQIAMLIDTDLLPAVYDASGAILTDETGNIILRY